MNTVLVMPSFEEIGFDKERGRQHARPFKILQGPPFRARSKHPPTLKQSFNLQSGSVAAPVVPSID